MRFLKFIMGSGLLILGIYFLGQNIVFTTKVSPYWWRDMSATGSVLALMSGIVTLIFFQENTGNLGWFLVIAGIALVFVSGHVLLLPTSLWSFFLAFSSMIAGVKLIRTGRVI